MKPPPPPEVPCYQGCKPLDKRKPSLNEVLNYILDRWSLMYPEKSSEPDKVSYKHVKPFLQHGPTCGLAAVGMVLTFVRKNWTIQELLSDAQTLGFSKRGEMFSVDNMGVFSKQVLGDHFSVEVFSDGLAASKTAIVDILMKGKGLYLVPYDADKDHSPGLFKGHKAHWALLCGVVIDNGNTYVLARQGKSRHIGIWGFDDLDRSNKNLLEMSPPRSNDDYISFDLKTSMAGKYIKLEGMCQITNSVLVTL